MASVSHQGATGGGSVGCSWHAVLLARSVGCRTPEMVAVWAIRGVTVIGGGCVLFSVPRELSRPEGETTEPEGHWWSWVRALADPGEPL
mmetsp:Transcript_44199/g.99720  ORF Transcript_44199/g.99720 Transcript_44199/m.99720 type:complete len:89 (+) Transcript_44199:1062-1328(+)